MFSFQLICYRRSIEDRVLLDCADLVANCVVVGYCKPIVVFVEPTSAHADSAEKTSGLKAEVIQRLENYQSSLFPHERFEDRVVVVKAGSLPRTTDKGNIRYKHLCSKTL